MKQFAITAFLLSAIYMSGFAQVAPRKVVTAANLKRLKQLEPQVKKFFYADSAAVRYLNLTDGTLNPARWESQDKYLIEFNLYYKQNKSNLGIQEGGQALKRLLIKEELTFLIEQMVVSIAMPDKSVLFYIYYL